MERLDLSYVDYNSLKRFDLPENINHNESSLFYSPFNRNEIIKSYYNVYLDANANEKIKEINNYITFIDDNNITELLKPTGLLYVENKFKGIILPRIDGQNASVYLNGKNTPIKIKIEILKQIGNILLKIRNTPPKYNAAFADVHADNFMVTNLEKNNFKTIGIDAESMKVLNSPGLTNFYLFNNDNIANLDKYDANVFGIVSPNSETDLYCFIMMILELISNNKSIYQLNINDFYKYLDYLDSLGINPMLLASFASIYKKEDNINPLPYLNTLNNMPSNTLYKDFKKHK